MSLTLYSDMRPSAEPWLGLVPAHWQMSRVRRLFQIEKRIAGQEGHDVLSITQRGIKVRDVDSNDGQLSMDYSNYQLVYPGDFAMNHMDLLTGYIDISRIYGVTSPDYRVFRSRFEEKLSPKYYLYIFQMCYELRIFYPLGQGSSLLGRWRLPTEAFNDFALPLPPLAEQHAIAAFLDRETAKIDTLVVEQERLIALLAEKRRAVISHAVTKGLDPDAPMKGSGFEWLGEVPAHWQAGALKRFWMVLDCKHITAEFIEDGIPLASIREVQSRYVDLASSKMTTKQFYELLTSDGRIPADGDLIFSRNATVGEVAQVCDWHPPFAMGQDVCLIRKKLSKYSSSFLQYVIKSDYSANQLAVCMVGSTFKRVNVEEIRSLVVPMPPSEEQVAIVTHLDRETAKLDTLAAEAERAIALLEERRAALISAAVTGKIDVREAVDAEEVAA